MRILIADHPDSMAPDHDYETQVLARGLGEVDVVVHPYAADRHAEFEAELAQADALLTGYLRIDGAMMQRAPKLKCISINATGYDNIDLDAARERDIGVMCIGEYCTEDVASHTIALILALNHHLKRYSADIDVRGEWRYSGVTASPRINEQVLGIVGLGRIGSRVAVKASALGMTVIAVDPFIDPSHARALGVELTSKDEVLARSDVISNHMNATAINSGYFDEAAFGAMVRRPLFVNTGRGSAVDESALLRALEQGRLRGVGLDVLKEEFPDVSASPLARREEVIITPHAAFYSSASIRALMDISCGNVVNYLTGRHDEVFKRVD